jgi:competence protein ComEC
MMLLGTPIAWLGSALCWLLGKTIYLMDRAIFLINKLPGSVADGLYTGQAETLMIYLLMTLTLLMVMYNKKQLVWAILALLITLSITFSWRRCAQFRQAAFIIHATRNHRAYEFVAGKDHFLFADSDDRQLLSEIGFHAGGYWIRNGLGPPRVFSTSYLQKDTVLDHQLYINQGFVNFFGKRIFFPEIQEIHGASPLKMELDILVLSGSPKLDFNHLEENFAIGAVVFDGTVDRRQASTWRAACDASGWAYHDVNTEGAFICNLE